MYVIGLWGRNLFIEAPSLSQTKLHEDYIVVITPATLQGISFTSLYSRLLLVGALE